MTPDPKGPAMTDKTETGWQWWSGPNNDYFVNGPFATREEAVDELDGEDGYVIEALKHAPVSFDAERLIEDQYANSEDLFDFDHCEPGRKGSKADIAAADAELQALLDAWCAKHGHTFNQPNMFAASRGEEFIPVQEAQP